MIVSEFSELITYTDRSAVDSVNKMYQSWQTAQKRANIV